MYNDQLQKVSGPGLGALNYSGGSSSSNQGKLFILIMENSIRRLFSLRGASAKTGLENSLTVRKPER